MPQTNANDVRLFNRAVEILEQYGCRVELSGTDFLVNGPKGNRLGGFHTAEILHSFACGYDWGRNHFARKSPVRA